MIRNVFLIGLVLIATGAASAQAPPLTYYAGMAGRLTTDRDQEGGNPFASALVEVMATPGMTLRDFGGKLAAATYNRSGGWQSPEVPKRTPEPDWSFADDRGEDRVALVLINADYSSSGVNSLPGAAFDAKRIPAALARAGFETELVMDADGAAIRAALEAFAARSANADVALVYLGGHGVQPGREVYWIFGDYPDPESRAGLDTHALAVSEAGRAAQARRLNFVFYAACRDNPFSR